ncbi:MAG: type II secretion system protein GspG [Phycisphaerales bacterium]
MGASQATRSAPSNKPEWLDWKAYVLGVIALALVAIWGVMLLTPNTPSLPGPEAAVSQLLELRSQIMLHVEDKKSLPAALSELSVDSKTLKDPWGTEFIYTVKSNKPKDWEYTLASAGPDKAPGTTDDMSWDVELTLDVTDAMMVKSETSKGIPTSTP